MSDIGICEYCKYKDKDMTQNPCIGCSAQMGAFEFDMSEHDANVRADAIDECIKLIGGNIKSIVGTYNKDTPLTDRASYRVAKNELIEELVKQLEQLKEQKQ